MAERRTVPGQASQAEGQQGQERGRPTERRKFLGFSFTAGKEPRRRIAPQALARLQEPSPGADAAHTRRQASRRSSRSCRAISSDGAATSASAKPRRCCADLTSGSGGGCAPSPGSNGSADALALRSCAAAASAGTWRRKPPAARTAPGGSATAPRSPSPCQMPSSTRSASLPSPTTRPLNPSNRRIRTRMYGGVGGVEPRGFPLSRSRVFAGPPEPVRLHAHARSGGVRLPGPSARCMITQLTQRPSL